MSTLDWQDPSWNATTSASGTQSAQGKRIEQQNYEDCAGQVANSATFNPASFVAADVGLTTVTAGTRLFCQTAGGSCVAGVYVATSATAATLSNTGADSVQQGKKLKVTGLSSGPVEYWQTGSATAVFERVTELGLRASYASTLATSKYANRPYGTPVFVDDEVKLYSSVPKNLGTASGTGNDWSAVALTAPSAPTLARVAPHDALAIAGGSAGPYGTPGPIGNATSSLEFVNQSFRYRIRQTGTIRAVEFALNGLIAAAFTFTIRIWRTSVPTTGQGGTLTLVAESEDLSTAMRAAWVANGSTYGGTCRVVLTTPLTGVHIGDLIGARLEGDESTTSPPTLYLWHGVRADGEPIGDLRFRNNVAAWVTGIDITTQSYAANFAIPIYVEMAPPYCVGIGDSLMQGVAMSWSFCQNATQYYLASNYWLDLVATGRGWSYQNMGWGGDLLAGIVARLTTDVINLHPQICMLEGGINDITNNAATADYCIGEYTTMLAALQAAGIVPFIMGIWPCGDATLAMWTNVITPLNAWLRANAAAYGGVYLNDAVASALGVFYTGGPAGNLWDIDPAKSSSSDHTHLILTGEQALASSLLAAMPFTP